MFVAKKTKQALQIFINHLFLNSIISKKHNNKTDQTYQNYQNFITKIHKSFN